MSDASHPHCRKCRQPDYACERDKPDFIDSVVNTIMRGEQPRADHPFYDNRKRRFDRA